MVHLLGGVAAELERLAHLRSRGAPAPGGELDTPAAARDTPVAGAEQHPDSLADATRMPGARDARADVYRRARRLLGQGHEAWAVRELTGLTLAELDLLAASAGSAPPPGPAVEVKS
jgi:hypothetical protein